MATIVVCDLCDRRMVGHTPTTSSIEIDETRVTVTIVARADGHAIEVCGECLADRLREAADRLDPKPAGG